MYCLAWNCIYWLLGWRYLKCKDPQVALWVSFWQPTEICFFLGEAYLDHYSVIVWKAVVSYWGYFPAAHLTLPGCFRFVWEGNNIREQLAECVFTHSSSPRDQKSSPAFPPTLWTAKWAHIPKLHTVRSWSWGFAVFMILHFIKLVQYDLAFILILYCNIVVTNVAVIDNNYFIAKVDEHCGNKLYAYWKVGVLSFDCYLYV